MPNMAKLYLNKGPYAVSAIVQKHFIDCGLTTTKEGTGVRKLVSRGFHSLRHSAVSIMKEAGTAQSTSQALIGHETEQIHQLYTHVDEDAKRRAVATLPAVIGKNVELVPTAKMIDTVLIQRLAKKMNSKNWRAVKEELLSAVK